MKAPLLLVVAGCLALAACTFTVNDVCSAGGGCPAGSFCGADGFCHAGSQDGGSSGGVGASASSGNGGSTSAAGASGGASGATSVGGTSGGSGSSGGASTGSGSGGSTGGTTGSACVGATSGTQGGAGAVTGTVTYSGTQPGTVFVELDSAYGPLLGTSLHVCGAGTFPFELQTVPSGSTPSQLSAWFDALGLGDYKAAADPFGSVTSGLQSAAIVLSAPTASPQVIAAPTFQAVAGENGGVLVFWNPITDDAGVEIVDHYVVCLSQGAGDAGCTRVVPTAVPLAIVSAPAGAAYTVSLAGELGSSIGMSATVTTGSADAGPDAGSLSGSIVGLSDGGGTLYVVAHANQGISAFTSLPPGASSYALPGLPAGTYGLFAFVDQTGSGQDLPGDPVNLEASGQGSCQVGPGCNATFEPGAVLAAATVATSEQSNVPQYTLNTRVEANQRFAVSAQVNGLPGGSPFDLPLERSNGDPILTFSSPLSLGSTQPAASYPLDVGFDDGTFATLILSVASPYFTSTPSVNAASGTITWTAPSGSDAPVSYQIQIGCNGGSGSTVTLLADAGLSYTPPGGLPDASITVTAVDAEGNTAQGQLGSCGNGGGTSGGSSGGSTGGNGGSPGTQTISGTLIYPGGESGPIFVNLSNGGLGAVAGTGITNQQGAFGGTAERPAVPFSFVGPSGQGTINAWMDLLGTGNYVFGVDPFGSATLSGTTTAVTLYDPVYVTPAQPPNAPTLWTAPDGVLAAFDPIVNSSGQEVPAYYSISWSINGINGGGAEIPAGSGTVAAVIGITPGGTISLQYQGLSYSKIGGALSPAATATVETGGTTLTGPLEAPYFNGGNVYVGMTYGPVFDYTPLSPALSSYTLPDVPFSPAELFAFVDPTGSGVFGPTTPGSLPNEPFHSATFEWDGGAAPSIGFSDAGVLCRVTTDVQPDGGGTQLWFYVQSNLDLPYQATVPDAGAIAALDLGASGAHQNHLFVLDGTESVSGVPQSGMALPIQVSTLTLGSGSAYGNAGPMETCTPVVTVLAPPTLQPAAAVDAGNGSPDVLFAWTLPDPALITSCQLSVNDNQAYASLQPCQGPIDYDSLQSSGALPPLQPGTAYPWTLTISDSSSDAATAAASFTP